MKITRISFIGHSMGGIIIRSALPMLESYKDKFFSYVSLSTPHLGYTFNKSILITTGLWVMQKWTDCTSLKQLSMKDHEDPQETFLYKLSSQKGRNWFKNIHFFSSIQDSYVSFDSARIQIFQDTQIVNPKTANEYLRMVTNLVRNLPQSSITRVDVNFKIKERSIDTLIGRKAHSLG